MRCGSVKGPIVGGMGACHLRSEGFGDTTQGAAGIGCGARTAGRKRRGAIHA